MADLLQNYANKLEAENRQLEAQIRELEERERKLRQFMKDAHHSAVLSARDGDAYLMGRVAGIVLVQDFVHSVPANEETAE